MPMNISAASRRVFLYIKEVPLGLAGFSPNLLVEQVRWLWADVSPTSFS